MSTYNAQRFRRQDCDQQENRRTEERTFKVSRDARIAAVRVALTAYFLGSAETEEDFWNKANPSGKLKLVEQCVRDLRKHVRSVRPKLDDEPTEGSFLVFEGKTQDALEKLKEIPADRHVIAIEFDNSGSYYTHGPSIGRCSK